MRIALRFFLLPLVVALFPVMLAGCYGSGDTRTEITETTEIPRDEAPNAQKLTAKQRLGLSRVAGQSPHGAPPAAPGATTTAPRGYAWDLPEGWVDRGATAMRLANVGLEGHPEVECVFTVLGGDGGGLAANLNRWRQQMGLPHYLPEELEALPRKPLLEQDAVFSVMDGSYGGMTGENVQDGWRMLGLTLVHEGAAYFVKMTGPAEVLEDEEANFLAFSASLRRDEYGSAAVSALPDTTSGELPPGHPPIDGLPTGDFPEGHPPISGNMQLPEGHPPIPGDSELPPGHPPIPGSANLPEGHPPIDSVPMTAGGASAPSAFHWAAPEGWVQAPDRPMREVTFTVDGAECYVAVLGGMAGGVDANINRWVGQMGQPPLGEAELRALPTITVMGRQVPMVQTTGNYTGMSGATQYNQKMLGVVCPLEGQTLFVKMTGPEDVVAAQAGNFVAFCESIHSSAH